MRSIVLIAILALGIPALCQSYIPEFKDVSIKVDGEFKEQAYSEITPIDSFTQYYPVQFGKPYQKTSVKSFLNREGIVFAIHCYDTAPDSVSWSLSERDDVGNADWFSILIDPFQKGITGYEFTITSRGVQIDKYVTQNDTDRSWNAVWLSQVKRTENGYQIEVLIPFSALRFPSTDVQDWNINFIRQIRRNRQEMSWFPIDQTVYGNLSQMGAFNQLQVPSVPIRLSFSPYVSSFVQHDTEPPNGAEPLNYGFSGGVDLKYGVTKSFTLDATLIPDFTNVPSDPLVLNLTPFEVQFDENRQFFTEGVDLFNRGNLFYSRRIGGRPMDYFNVQNELDFDESLTSNPSQTLLFNALKFSGRTDKGTGIGVLNAVTRNAKAEATSESGDTREIITNPISNYNVFVVDQSFGENSYVSFTNASVWRAGEAYDANNSAIELNYLSKNRKFNVRSVGAMTNQFYLNDYKNGHRWYLATGKVSGMHQYGVTYEQIDGTYDPNDIGFQAFNNFRRYNANYSFNYFKSFWIMQRAMFRANVNHERLFTGNKYIDFNIDTWTGFTFNNFLWMNFEFAFQPIAKHDYFEARSLTEYLAIPANYNTRLYFSSDYSKRVAIDIGGDFRDYVTNQYDVGGDISLRFRVSDAIFIIPGYDHQYLRNNKGYIGNAKSVLGLNDDFAVIANRDRHVSIFTLRNEFIITNRMGFNLNLRYYRGTSLNKSFYELENDGSLTQLEFDGLDNNGNPIYDQNFNSWNIYLIYRWVFAPGSELSFTWKNTILTNNSEADKPYFDNLGDIFGSNVRNLFSIKFLYYIDVLYFKKWFKKKI